MRPTRFELTKYRITRNALTELQLPISRHGSDVRGAVIACDEYRAMLPLGCFNSTGARCVAVFRVDGGLWAADGNRVQSLLRRIGAMNRRAAIAKATGGATKDSTS